MIKVKNAAGAWDTSFSLLKPLREGTKKQRRAHRKQMFSDIKNAGFEVKRKRTFTFSTKTAKIHYDNKKEFDFFEKELVPFMTGKTSASGKKSTGKSTAFIVKGDGAKYREFANNVLRPKYKIDPTANGIHSSENAEDALEETNRFYKPGFLIRNFAQRVGEKISEAFAAKK